MTVAKGSIIVEFHEHLGQISGEKSCLKSLDADMNDVKMGFWHQTESKGASLEIFRWSY